MSYTHQNGQTVVNETLAHSGSVTVPSGETWDVSVSWNRSTDTSDGSLIVNGTDLYIHDGDVQETSSYSMRLVLPAGTTIEIDNGYCSISGYEVSGTVGNDPVLETITENESVTVPSGETWRVAVAYSNNSATSSYPLTLNGNTIVSANYSGPTIVLELVLEPGDTLELDGYGGTHTVISGWTV